MTSAPANSIGNFVIGESAIGAGASAIKVYAGPRQQGSCNDGTQAYKWCPVTTDEVLPSILGLLPSGPAWEGARQLGTVMNQFWRSISNLTAWSYKRLQDFWAEMYCNTAYESLDQWRLDYGLPDDCDVYGYNLCAKVTAVGGQSCDIYVELARLNGWAIACENVSIPEPVAGCFQIGCTPLGQTPVYNGGASVGFGDLCLCEYDEVTQHPEPQYWEQDKTNLAYCAVPGSNLGLSSGSPGCCFIVGYYEQPSRSQTPTRNDACVGESDRTIYFPTPAVHRLSLEYPTCDTNGNYTSFGQAHVWRVTVDIVKSRALQGVEYKSTPISNAGNFVAGCTSLCGPEQLSIECLLERVKPAHTVLSIQVIQ